MNHFIYMWSNGLWLYVLLLFLMFSLSCLRIFLVCFCAEKYCRKKYKISNMKWRLTAAYVLAEVLVYLFFCFSFLYTGKELSAESPYFFLFGGTILNTLFITAENYSAKLLHFIFGVVLWFVISPLFSFIFAKRSLKNIPRKISILLMYLCALANIPIHFFILLDGLIMFK